MAEYPNYTFDTSFHGNKCTVTVRAATQCGPRIEAKSTIDMKAKETQAAAEKSAKGYAVRNLASEYEIVAASCAVKGKHRGHRP